jgi:hypothetical protein
LFLPYLFEQLGCLKPQPGNAQGSDPPVTRIRFPVGALEQEQAIGDRPWVARGKAQLAGELGAAPPDRPSGGLS